MSDQLAKSDCQDVVIRAVRALDGRDYDTMTSSFAPDGVWERGGARLAGPAAIRAALDERPADLETQHLVSNMVVDLAPDGTAEVRYTLSAYAQRAGETFHLHAILKATDCLTRTDGGWKFSHRAVEPAFSPRPAV